jgi:hypothetical protein
MRTDIRIAGGDFQPPRLPLAVKGGSHVPDL